MTLTRCLLFASIGLAAVSAAGADTVLLANGNRFDDVIASVEVDGGVTVRFSYGEMKLPAELVTRVEKGDSRLVGYLEEFDRLAADPRADGRAWLDLALGARSAGLDDGYRRAVRRAAEAEPEMAALGPHMSALGFVFDAERRSWITVEERAAQRAAREPVREPQPAPIDRERDRLLAALELLALAELAEELERRERRPEPARPAYGLPLYGVVGPLIASPGGAPVNQHNLRTMEGLTRRQPGSLLPVVPRSHGHSRSPAVGER